MFKTPLFNDDFILLLVEEKVKKNDCARKFFCKNFRKANLLLFQGSLLQLFVDRQELSDPP